MKYCAYCGRELFDEAVVCPGCGRSVDEETRGAKAVGAEANGAKAVDEETSGAKAVGAEANGAEAVGAEANGAEQFATQPAEENANNDGESAENESNAWQNPPTGKKKRGRSIAAIALFLVVCASIAAVLVYNTENSIKGLTFESAQDMMNYANGYYKYEGTTGTEILYIDDFDYYSCQFSDIEFNGCESEYIDESNYAAKELDFDINDNVALMNNYMKKSSPDEVELKHDISNGLILNAATDEKLFAVQDDGVLVPLFESNRNKEAVKRTEPEKLIEENAGLKEALEKFRSDYESAVAEIEAKEAYFPTVDEYISEFEKFGFNFTRVNYYNDNYVLLKWKVEWNRLVTFSYQLMLFVNADNRVTDCSVNIYDTHFLNKFRELLPDEAKINTYVYLTLPAFLLCSMHNGVECDADEFNEFTGGKMNELFSEGKYSAIYNGCEFNVSISEFQFSCSLDWGDFHKKNSKAD